MEQWAPLVAYSVWSSGESEGTPLGGGGAGVKGDIKKGRPRGVSGLPPPCEGGEEPEPLYHYEKNPGDGEPGVLRV